MDAIAVGHCTLDHWNYSTSQDSHNQQGRTLAFKFSQSFYGKGKDIGPHDRVEEAYTYYRPHSCFPF